MLATLHYNNGDTCTAEVPSQRTTAYSDYIVIQSTDNSFRVFKRLGSVTDNNFQEVSGRIVTGYLVGSQDS